MNNLLYTIAIITLLGCADSGGGSKAPAPKASTPQPIVTPAPVVTPTPEPVVVEPTPTPTPVVYTCLNHPLSGHKVFTYDSTISIMFNSDCTYIFTDTFHQSYGSWAPNPSPDAVITESNSISYPMDLSPNSAYVCFPAYGPQTCSNDGYAGPVVVSIARSSPNTGLVIH